MVSDSTLRHAESARRLSQALPPAPPPPPSGASSLALPNSCWHVLSSSTPMVMQGGKLTSPDQADIVHLVQVGRKQLLWYEAPPKVHAALLRGTTADLDGNISFEKEALHLDSLNMVRVVPFLRLCKAPMVARCQNLKVWGYSSLRRPSFSLLQNLSVVCVRMG